MSPQIYNLEIEDVLKKMETTREGLTQEEAEKRLKLYGPNALKTPKTPLWKRLIEPFANIFVVVLLIALIISLFEGKTIDAVIIGIIVIINAFIYYFQQISVQRVLTSLKKQDISHADVLRDGKAIQINSDDLTLGDVIYIIEGMKIPADGRLIQADQLQVDEAMLTGESIPIHKQTELLKGEHEVYDRKNMLFKGTYIKSGSGLLVITAIGDHTELGAINKLATHADIGRSPIERKIDKLIKSIIIAISIGATIALFLAILRGISIDEALRFCLTLVVSAVPEGLPVALTVVMLLSARRMAKGNALVKNISSIETMGALTYIVTDKTGTITQNKLSVAQQETTHKDMSSFNEVIRASLNGNENHVNDPLDHILLDAVKGIKLPATWKKIKDLPFNQKLRISGTLWQQGKKYMLYVKGAPEQILEKSQLEADEEKMNGALRDFTSQGYRTIAFAHKTFETEPKTLNAIEGLQFDGFVGLSDSLRTHVKSSIKEAKQAGIKVVMITGDHIATAGNIAKKVGIAKNDNQIYDASILQNDNPEAIRHALQEARVFGRVLPEHKFALLKAVKKTEITAMTGDGVNDIPALIEADAGLAMGSGADAAKDASDIVLIDNNFHSIVEAVKVGRTAIANIKKMLIYLLGTSGGEMLTMLAALVLNLPLPVTAIQVLWINLVTDGISVIPLGLSPAESEQIKQKPNDPKAPLLDGRLLSRFITMAVVMSTTILLIFWMNLDRGHEYAQSIAFISLMVVQWVNALSVNLEYRPWIENLSRPNKTLFWALGLSALVQIIILLSPLKSFLGVVPVDFGDLAIGILIPCISSIIAVDLHKFITRKRSEKKEHLLEASS